MVGSAACCRQCADACFDDCGWISSTGALRALPLLIIWCLGKSPHGCRRYRARTTPSVYWLVGGSRTCGACCGANHELPRERCLRRIDRRCAVEVFATHAAPNLCSVFLDWAHWRRCFRSLTASSDHGSRQPSFRDPSLTGFSAGRMRIVGEVRTYTRYVAGVNEAWCFCCRPRRSGVALPRPDGSADGRILDAGYQASSRRGHVGLGGGDAAPRWSRGREPVTIAHCFAGTGGLLGWSADR